MAKKSHYAVKVGYKSDTIVGTWDECSALVTGFPGAIFKGFTSEKDAQNFLNNTSRKKKKKNIVSRDRKKPKQNWIYSLENGVRFGRHPDGPQLGELCDPTKLYCSEEPPWETDEEIAAKYCVAL